MDEITKHHLQNLADKNYIENEDGSISTVKTIIVNIDGEETLIPSLWDGKILSPEDAAKKAIESGKNWPSISATKDSAIEKLNEFDKEIHKNFKPLTSNKAKKILSIGERYTPTNQFDSLALEIIEGNKNKKETYGVGEDKNYQTITPVTEDNPLGKFTDKYLRFGKDNNIQINPDLFGAEKGFNVKIIQNKAKGGEVMKKPTEEQQMEMMLEGGGLKDEGGTTDPVSGNEVPDGATQKGVRDDVPAMLSEGEYVMNEASTRYHGVDKFNQMQEEAKQGYVQMERDGLLGEPVDDTEEALPFGMADLNVSDEEGRELMMAEGGDVSTQRKLLQDDIDSDVFNVRRREQPTFGESMGGSGLQFKQYKNADGMNVMIPFINGVPMFSIPEGYELVDPNDPDATPEPTPVDPREEVLEPVETPEYGGELDELGMPVGAVGSSKSLVDAAISMSELTTGQRKPTYLESLFMKTPVYNSVTKMQMKRAGLKDTGNSIENQRQLSMYNLQNNMARVGQESEDYSKLADALANNREFTTDENYNTVPTAMNPSRKSVVSPTYSADAVTAQSKMDQKAGGEGYDIGMSGPPSFGYTGSDDTPNTEFGGEGPDVGGDAGGAGSGAPGGGISGDSTGAGDFGIFNKGGLAGSKPKKKTKTYKKGGLATR